MEQNDEGAPHACKYRLIHNNRSFCSNELILSGYLPILRAYDQKPQTGSYFSNASW